MALLWPAALNLDLKERFSRRESYEAFAGRPAQRQAAAADGPQQPHTLVVYVFSGSDPEYANNLRFFVREAVKVEPLLQ